MPLVSIVMPVYNAEPFLRDSINSVLNQNYENIELLIINDGSDDESLGIAKQFLHIDARVKVFDTPNAGVSSKRNLGLSLAQGEFIAWLDADDLALPNRVNLQVEHFIKFPDVDLIGGGCILIDKFGEKLGPVVFEPESYEAILSQLCIDNSFINSTVMIRSKVAKKYHFNMRYVVSEDYDYYSRIALSHICINLPICLVFYRVHGTSISFSKINLIKNNSFHISVIQLIRYLNGSIDIGIIKSFIKVKKYGQFLSIKNNIRLFIFFINIYFNNNIKDIISVGNYRIKIIFSLASNIYLIQLKNFLKKLLNK